MRLAQWPESSHAKKSCGSKAALEARLQRPIDAFCYPVGDPTSAGKREFALAKEAGFKLAVTTRPGLSFPEHVSHLFALPRVSLNGLWQNVGYLDVLLSGAAFALWNFGRRVDAD